jgi:multiple sugar transport system ATP-binding protein
MNLELPQSARQKAHERATSPALLLGVRPQHAKIHRGAQETNGRNVISGTVYVAEPLGTEQLVRVRVGQELVQVLAGDELQVDMDEPVSLEIPPDRFFLFDAETEKRVA